MLVASIIKDWSIDGAYINYFTGQQYVLSEGVLELQQSKTPTKPCSEGFPD